MKINVLLMATAAIVLGACALPLPQEETKADEAELANVRIVPASQVNNCEFITQTNILQGQSFFGGQADLASNAEKRLKQKAVSLGADTVVIADRIYDDGGGTGKQPTLSLFADLYRCKSRSGAGIPTPESRSAPKPEPLAHSPEPLPAGGSRNNLIKAQSKLKDIGYYTGDVDGIYGPETAKAIRAFQQHRNLPVTGSVDTATLDQLDKAEWRGPTITHRFLKSKTRTHRETSGPTLDHNSNAVVLNVGGWLANLTSW